MSAQDDTIRIRKSPNGEWRAFTLLEQKSGWALVKDGLGGGLWVQLRTDHIHPSDIAKLFAPGQTKVHEIIKRNKSDEHPNRI